MAIGSSERYEFCIQHNVFHTAGIGMGSKEPFALTPANEGFSQPEPLWLEGACLEYLQAKNGGYFSRISVLLCISVSRTKHFALQRQRKLFSP